MSSTMMRLPELLILAICITWSLAGDQYASTRRLRDQLLKDIHKHVVPVGGEEKPVTVQLGMAAMHIEVDEKASCMELHSWMRLVWTNNLLTWDPDEFSGVKKLYIHPHEVWKPDIVLYNSLEAPHVAALGQTQMILYTNGEVLWVPPAKFRAFCNFDLKYWPMDEQVCELKFGSWTSDGTVINLTAYNNAKEVDTSERFGANHHWKILSTEATRNVKVYDCCPEEYIDIVFKFRIQRNSGPYVPLLVLPWSGLMLMTLCSFLLAPDSVVRLVLNAFAIIGTILYLLYFASMIPYHLDTVPILVRLYSDTSLMAGLAVLLNTIILDIARRRKYTRPPTSVIAILSGFPCNRLCLGSYIQQVSATHKDLGLEMEHMDDASSFAGRVEPLEDNLLTNNGDLEVGSGIGQGAAGKQMKTFGSQLDAAAMREWLLVAAALSRMVFIIYFCIFLINGTSHAWL